MPLHLLRVLLISSTFMTRFPHFSSSRLCSNSSRSPFNSLYLDFKSVGSSPALIVEIMLLIFFVVLPILALMFLCISSRMSLGFSLDSQASLAAAETSRGFEDWLGFLSPTEALYSLSYRYAASRETPHCFTHWPMEISPSWIRFSMRSLPFFFIKNLLSTIAFFVHFLTGDCLLRDQQCKEIVSQYICQIFYLYFFS